MNASLEHTLAAQLPQGGITHTKLISSFLRRG
jgi:hypothetical protein